MVIFEGTQKKLCFNAFSIEKIFEQSPFHKKLREVRICAAFLNKAYLGKINFMKKCFLHENATVPLKLIKVNLIMYNMKTFFIRKVVMRK